MDAGFVCASATVLIEQEKRLDQIEREIETQSESSTSLLTRSENCAKLCRQVCHTTTLMIDGQEIFKFLISRNSGKTIFPINFSLWTRESGLGCPRNPSNRNTSEIRRF